MVDPSDGTTIIFTKDDGGGLPVAYRAVKTASATWEWDPTPIVSGLDNPSGLEIDLQGNLWWVHDNTPALMRLEAPWAENTPELVISNFG